jgi:hypothetical protein
MALSALESALKPLGALADDPSSDEYKLALADLRKSIDARRSGSGLDPAMLALAQGFFAPTKSGSTGESISNAVGQYVPAYQANEKLKTEDMMLRLQIAQAEKQQALKTKAQEQFGQAFGQTPITPSTIGGEKTATPSGATSGTKTGTTQQPVGQMKTPTLNDALRFIQANPDQPELGKTLLEAVKIGSERFKIAQNGTVFDTQEAKYSDEPPPGQVQSDFYIRGLGKVPMLPSQYQDYLRANKAGQGKEWITEFTGRKFSGEDNAPVTSAEIKAQEEKGVLRAKGEDPRFQSIVNAGAEAPAKLATYGVTKELVNKKGMEKVLGIFERPDFMSAVGKLIENGIGVAGFKIGQDNIRDIMKDLGLPQDLINDSQLIASQIANINFGFRSLAKGQGAISNFEQEMFNSMGPTAKDNVQTIQKKLSMLEERAKFEQNLSKELRKSKMDADDFKDSPTYQNLVNDYQRRLIGIVSPEKAKSSTPSSPSAPTEAGDILRKKLGLR